MNLESELNITKVSQQRVRVPMSEIFQFFFFNKFAKMSTILFFPINVGCFVYILTYFGEGTSVELAKSFPPLYFILRQQIRQSDTIRGIKVTWIEERAILLLMKFSFFWRSQKNNFLVWWHWWLILGMYLNISLKYQRHMLWL